MDKLAEKVADLVAFVEPFYEDNQFGEEFMRQVFGIVGEAFRQGAENHDSTDPLLAEKFVEQFKSELEKIGWSSDDE